MAAKIGLFGAEHGNYVDIPFDVPLKLNKLEAWTDDTKGIITGIQFTCTDNALNPLPPVHYGSIDSTNSNYKILFDIEAQGAGDYVVNLYGSTANNFVTRLGVKTNKRAGEPCGRETGRYFEIPVMGGAIVAFFGRSDGKALHAVGAYVLAAP